MRRCAWAVLLAMLILVGQPLAAQPRPGKTVLVVGRVSDNPKKHLPELKALASFVASRLRHAGIERAEVVMAPDNDRMLANLLRGKVDWITETPLSATLFEEKGGALPILRRWERGTPGKRTVVVARIGSGVAELSDLLGRVVAFEDRGSTTGFFLPASAIVERGLALEELSSLRETPAPDRVGFVFAHDELNVTTWVSMGLVAAGALSAADLQDDSEAPPALREKLEVIYESPTFPTAFELVRADLAEDLRQALQQMLLEAHESPEGRDALRRFRNTERFTAIDEEAARALRDARRIRARVSAEVDP